MTRRTASLQSRLLTGVLGVVGLGWVLAAALVWVDARHELDELLDAHLAQSAALLVAQQTHNGAVDEDDEPADAPSLHRYAPNVAFQVWHEGRLMLRSANVAPQPLSVLADGFDTIEMDGLTWRLFAARGAEADVQVFVAEQLHSRGEILKAVLRGLLMPALLMLPLVGGAAWWAVRSGLSPLRSLSEVLSARSPLALAPVRLPGGAPAELRAPLDALNQLLGRMATLLDGERRFTADAAHELRTPIAAVRAQAQVALGAQDAAERQHALEATLAGCDRATHLVQQLLTLARLEAAEAPPPDELADLPAIARQVIGDLVPDALARDQAIVLDAPGPCSVPADAGLVSVLLRNLVDNALRYSPAGASVQVGLRAQPGTVTLSVEDSGPGLPAEHLARLGERFFRPPGQAATGSGLGWSIVRRIAQAQGAQLQISRSTGLGGLAVRVVWAVPRSTTA